MEISISDFVCYCVECVLYPAANIDPYDYMPGDINDMYRFINRMIDDPHIYNQLFEEISDLEYKLMVTAKELNVMKNV